MLSSFRRVSIQLLVLFVVSLSRGADARSRENRDEWGALPQRHLCEAAGVGCCGVSSSSVGDDCGGLLLTWDSMRRITRNNCCWANDRGFVMKAKRNVVLLSVSRCLLLECGFEPLGGYDGRLPDAVVWRHHGGMGPRRRLRQFGGTCMPMRQMDMRDFETA